jgi:hypothetical protein
VFILDYATTPQYAQAQISTAPAAATTTANSTTSCEKFPVAGVTASANRLMALNVLDNNFNTAWSSNVIGSWIQVDLGVWGHAEHDNYMGRTYFVIQMG